MQCEDPEFFKREKNAGRDQKAKLTEESEGGLAMYSVECRPFNSNHDMLDFGHFGVIIFDYRAVFCCCMSRKI